MQHRVSFYRRLHRTGRSRHPAVQYTVTSRQMYTRVRTRASATSANIYTVHAARATISRRALAIFPEWSRRRGRGEKKRKEKGTMLSELRCARKRLLLAGRRFASRVVIGILRSRAKDGECPSSRVPEFLFARHSFLFSMPCFERRYVGRSCELSECLRLLLVMTLEGIKVRSIAAGGYAIILLLDVATMEKSNSSGTSVKQTRDMVYKSVTNNFEGK